MQDLKILIIDDYIESAETIKEAIGIKHPNIDVEIAENGTEGYGHCCLTRYDLILCDYKMPHLNGVKTGQYINTSEESKNKDTPFVLMSSYIPELSRAESFEFASLILEKPINIETALSKLKLLLGSKLAA